MKINHLKSNYNHVSKKLKNPFIKTTFLFSDSTRRYSSYLVSPVSWTGVHQLHVPRSVREALDEVDEDDDGMISFREFMMIFRKAAAGELKEDSGLGVLAKQFEIDVDEVGVEGAKTFFEAKVMILMIDWLIEIIFCIILTSLS